MWYELRQNSIYVYYKPIQYGTTKNHYLQNFMPDGNLDFWDRLFDTQIIAEASGEGPAMDNASKVVKVVVRIHLINDGNNYIES